MNPLPGSEFEVVREPKEAELQGDICHPLEILCIEIDAQALGDPVGSPSGRGQIAMGSIIRVLGGGLSRGRTVVPVCLCSFLETQLGQSTCSFAVCTSNYITSTFLHQIIFP